MRSSHKKSPPQDSSNQEKVSTAKKGVEAPFLLGHFARMGNAVAAAAHAAD